MKKSLFASWVIAVSLLFISCGDTATGILDDLNNSSSGSSSSVESSGSESSSSGLSSSEVYSSGVSSSEFSSSGVSSSDQSSSGTSSSGISSSDQSSSGTSSSGTSSSNTSSSSDGERVLSLAQSSDDIILSGQEKQWYFTGIAGRSYTIYTSGSLDTKLNIETTSGSVIAFDDDDGEGLNASVTFTMPSSGQIIAVVSLFGSSLGGNYTISVTDEGGSSSSSGTVSPAIFSPLAGELYEVGQTMVIEWEENGFSAPVDITLLRNGYTEEQIISNTANDGLYSLTIPSSIARDNNYEIRITDGVNSVTSSEFSITEDLSSNDLVIKVTWDNGTTSNGYSIDEVDVDLHVTTPEGNHIYYMNTSGDYNDYLDLDNTWGFGPEIYVRPVVTSGTFEVSANVYNLGSNHSSVTITIEVIKNGVSSTYSETLYTYDENGSNPDAWFFAPDVVF